MIRLKGRDATQTAKMLGLQERKPAKRPRGKNPESALVKACLELLKLHGILAWRNNNYGFQNAEGRWIFHGRKGVSDIVGCLRAVGASCWAGGRFLGIECKVGNGKLSDEQEQWKAEIEQAGGIVLVVREIDDLRSWLRDMGY